MSDTATPPPVTTPAPVAKPSSSGAVEVTGKLVLLVLIVMAGIIGVALAIVYHYPKASETTSVLGVILPVFTAVMGAALGTGVGSAAGSAGKKAAEQNAAQSDQKDAQSKKALLAVKAEMQTAKPDVAGVFESVKTGMVSPAGQADFVAVQPGDTPFGASVDGTQMDRASAALERIQAIVDSALAAG
jgi:hypothetical protein